MFKFFLSTSYRLFLKQKSHSIINMVGLIIGVLCFIFIHNYCFTERSYDRFHNENENIYRVTRRMLKNKDLLIHSASVPVKMGPALCEEFPEIIQSSTVCVWNEVLFGNNENSFRGKSVAFVDTTFLKLFNYKILRSNSKLLLSEPNTTVLTESVAKKLYGNIEKALDNKLTITHPNGNKYDVSVVGIIEDFPVNSHLRTDALISLANFTKARGGEFWASWSMHIP